LIKICLQTKSKVRNFKDTGWSKIYKHNILNDLKLLVFCMHYNSRISW